MNVLTEVIGVFFFSIILGALMEYKFKLFFWTIMIFAAVFVTALFISPDAGISSLPIWQTIIELIAAILGNITGKLLMRKYKEDKQ